MSARRSLPNEYGEKLNTHDPKTPKTDFPGPPSLPDKLIPCWVEGEATNANWSLEPEPALLPRMAPPPPIWSLESSWNSCTLVAIRSTDGSKDSWTEPSCVPRRRLWMRPSTRFVLLNKRGP